MQDDPIAKVRTSRRANALAGVSQYESLDTTEQNRRLMTKKQIESLTSLG